MTTHSIFLFLIYHFAAEMAERGNHWSVWVQLLLFSDLTQYSQICLFGKTTDIQNT